MNSSLSNIKACVFDAYGTLFKLDIPMDQVDQFCNGKGVELMAIWRRKQLEYTWLRSLMDSYIPFNEVTRAALVFAMESVGTQEEALFDLLLPIYEKANCFPEVELMLKQLKANGIRSAILSNGTERMLKTGAENASIDSLLDHIFSVDAVGIFKPSPLVYQMAVDQLQLQPKEILFLSSNQWDIAGATRFGLTTVWVNQYQQIPERLGENARFTLSKLSDLFSLLQVKTDQ